MTRDVYTVFCKKIVNTYNPMVATARVYLLVSIFQLSLLFLQLHDQSFVDIPAGTGVILPFQQPVQYISPKTFTTIRLTKSAHLL